MLLKTLVAFTLIFGSSAFALPGPFAENTTVELERRLSGEGRATWYSLGAGILSCGKQFTDSDLIVAVSAFEYGTGGLCGKTIQITSKGKTVSAQVQDYCASCLQFDLDLTEGLFQQFAPLSTGVIDVEWVIQ